MYVRTVRSGNETTKHAQPYMVKNAERIESNRPDLLPYRPTYIYSRHSGS